MSEVAARDLEYFDGETRLIGYFAARPGVAQPGLILVHDAFGVSPAMQERAQRTAALGYAVLLADMWGERRTPQSVDEIGPLVGGMVSDHDMWIGRMRSAHRALLAQSEVDADNVAAFGYCFGGSSVLEYARAGEKLKGVVTFHAGLDAVSNDWTPGATDAKILILTGAQDPMAKPDAILALQDGLTAAGVEWEVVSYSDTRHAFTNPHADAAGQPELAAYSARADRRSWDAFRLFLEEIFETDVPDA